MAIDVLSVRRDASPTWGRDFDIMERFIETLFPAFIA